MARINIEESLWADARFLRFCVKTGDEARAVGHVVMAYRLAQKHWCPGKRPVPSAEWEMAGLPQEMIECGLAETREGGVYVRGSETQFAWWFQKVEAGKLGGRPKAGAKQKKAGAKRSLSTSEAHAKRVEPSSSFSFSSSDSSSESNSESFLYSVGEGAASEGGQLPEEGIRSPIGFFIANYVNAYQVRYGMNARPALSGKVQGQIKRFLADTPLERACHMIQTYCGMSDQWFMTKAHDFGTFVENLSKVGVALDTGRVITRKEAQHAETGDYYRNQMARLGGGKDAP